MQGASEFLQTLRKQRHLELEALPPGGLALWLAKHAGQTPFLILAADEERAERLAADLQGLGVDDCYFFGAEEYVPFEDIAPDAQVTAARFALRQRLLGTKPPSVVVASAAAIQGRWMPTADFTATRQTWRVSDAVDRDQMARHLLRCGFLPVNFVEDEGTYAIRGGVVDVFVPGHKLPTRMDLFGDDIASIKPFAPDTQRALAGQESLTIFPIREVIYDTSRIAHAQAALRAYGESHAIPSRRLRSLIESIGQQQYFYGLETLWPLFYEGHEGALETLLSPQSVVVFDEPDSVFATLEKRWQRAGEERDKAIARHQPAVPLDQHLTHPEAIEAALTPYLRVDSVLLAVRGGQSYSHGISDCRTVVADMAARRADVQRGEILDPLVELITRQAQAGKRVYLACGSRGHAERLREIFLARRLDVPIWDRTTCLQWLQREGVPRVVIGVTAMAASLRDSRTDLILISDVDIFAVPPKRLVRGRRKINAQGLSTLRDLREGDVVIHQDHGIGRYLGLRRLILNGSDGDYVHLEYADGDKLYVPIYHLGVLQRYHGPSEQVRLDKLGSRRWERAKQRVKDAVLATAHQLLALQAARKSRPGFRLPAPDAHFRAFEARFPYDETPDQQRAIDEVLADLQRDTPMDRLVCGDVGFGKTEVALRGTFLAVIGRRQVAVLVPTTVLAEQHRATFAERLEGEGVVVEVLSRFRSPKETQSILRRVREGSVDVLIGTHRLLSADVAFKNLGLLVVDEEQRFGVKHKERIKQMRSQVHVLTLSATPIPRTLHMASVGLRDLSIIQTPPMERSPIRTEVLRFDEAVMAQAMGRELHRGGQVFVVHNRVHSIEAMANLVRRLVPAAKVGIAHGQMSADQLERIMVDFVRRNINVLVCTAIIESGIDIPSANTMVVNRADTFGLAQLYQLRGRIGRGRDRAYAYLMLPRSDRIGPDAAARLAVLKRFSELGAGFQIASHDLELRGAGDLLGADQSGNIAAVGFELYTELLAEAVERARGGETHLEVEPDLKLPVSAVLPEAYVSEPMQRLAYYQRFAQARSDAAVYDIFAEIKDVYGPAPPEVAALCEVMVIRRRLKMLGASALTAAAHADEVRLAVTFLPTAPIDREELIRRCQQDREGYRMLPSGRLAITVKVAQADNPQHFLQAVRQALGALPGRSPSMS